MPDRHAFSRRGKQRDRKRAIDAVMQAERHAFSRRGKQRDRKRAIDAVMHARQTCI